MKIFEKKDTNKKRKFYFFGIKVFSCKRDKKQNIYNEYSSKFKQAGWTLKREGKKYILSNGDITVFGDADNTLWTAYGVFCSDEYAFFTKDPYIMIDIGANLGFTSLRLATEQHIKKIYAFEPFSPTYKLALDNLNQNPQYSKKIQIFNFGLSNKDFIKKIHYNPDFPGSMSTIKDQFENSQIIETVHLKKASDIIKKILKTEGGGNLFMKIDCEGAEKEIIPDLANSGILKQIKLIIMEWHFESPKRLIEILNNEGFVVTCQNDVIDKLGTITAFRK